MLSIYSVEIFLYCQQRGVAMPFSWIQVVIELEFISDVIIEFSTLHERQATIIIPHQVSSVSS